MTGTKQTKMAAALTNALENCRNEGRNPGRIGRVIVTINAKHGNNGTPAKKTNIKADSAVGGK